MHVDRLSRNFHGKCSSRSGLPLESITFVTRRRSRSFTISRRRRENYNPRKWQLGSAGIFNSVEFCETRFIFEIVEKKYWTVQEIEFVELMKGYSTADFLANTYFSHDVCIILFVCKY